MNKIKVTHPCGKVETIKGDFKDGVKIELVKDEPEMYWWNDISLSFWTEKNPNWDSEFKKTGAPTKRKALLNFMQFVITEHSNSYSFKRWLQEAIDALDDLERH